MRRTQRVVEDPYASYELLSHLWDPILEEYTLRQLSFGADKFPALSGLASMISENLTLTYAAGLWREYLPVQLAWQMLFVGSAVRSKDWRAPSWSWASVDGGVCNMSQYKPWMKLLVQEWRVHGELAGTDPSGRLASASLTITGPLKQTSLRKGELGWHIAAANQIFGYVLLDDKSEFQEETYCLGLMINHNPRGQKAHVSYTFLVLIRTSQKNEYLRIGLGHSLYKVDFPASEMQSIVIV